MNTLKLNEQKVWHGTHEGVSFKIVNWGNEYDGPWRCWNYYVYLHEQKCRDFGSLWLPDITYQNTPESPVRATHDYYSVAVLNEIELHGGITWYEKFGHTEGHRMIEVGCDYQHIWDEEHGPYTLEEICEDVKRTCELVKQLIYKDGLDNP